MGYVMGIDLGTSSTKALIMDAAGNCMGIGHGTYEVSIPRMSYAQQDPADWYDAVIGAIAEALSVSGMRGEDIDGVGFSGQMHGCVALDKDYQVIYPAIIHLDQRCAEELPLIREKAGDLMQTELLNQPSAGMLIGSLYWLKVHEPKVYERIHVVMSPKDYIRFLLVGEIGTEYSDASATLAFSVREKRWCTELFERLGLRTDIWPEVHGSSEVAGHITHQAAAETGLSVRTAVVYGGGDSLCALTGNGVIEKGAMACNIGTASQLCVVADQPIFDPQMRVQTWCHTVPERWAVQSGALNGGSTLNWLKHKILKTTLSYGDLDTEAGMTEAGADGLYFVPYLTGERTPFNDPKAKGIYFGLGMKHEQGHLIRATMEGVMLNMKECLSILDEMKVERKLLIASGGAARGNTWKQIQADMLNMPVHTTLVSEEACQGAAMMALVGTGAYTNLAEAAKSTVRLSPNVVEPIPSHVKLYEAKQEVFHELYERTKELAHLGL